MPRIGNKELVKTIMEKVNLSSKRVCRRATNYLRFLETQLISRTRCSSLPHSARVCICIELATFYYSLPVIRKRLIRLSGLSKRKYSQMYDVYRKSVRIDNELSIAHICLQLNVVEAAEMAEKIYEFYAKKSHDPNFSDKSPSYKVVSVYCACRRLEIRLQKVHCYDCDGHITASAFKTLVENFEKILNDYQYDPFNMRKSVRSRLKNQDTDLKDVDEPVAELEPEKNSDDELYEDSSAKENFEDYATWKGRILREANAQLKTIY